MLYQFAYPKVNLSEYFSDNCSIISERSLQFAQLGVYKMITQDYEAKVLVIASMLSSVSSLRSGVSPSKVKPLDSLVLRAPNTTNTSRKIDKSLIVCIFGSAVFLFITYFRN